MEKVRWYLSTWFISIFGGEIHVEIRQMYKRNFTVSQIAKQLKISRTTVYKYLDMTFEEIQK